MQDLNFVAFKNLQKLTLFKSSIKLGTYIYYAIRLLYINRVKKLQIR